MNSIIEKRVINQISILIFLLITVLLWSPDSVFPQTQKKGIPPKPEAHQEVIDDDYIPVTRDQLGRSPSYRFSTDNITTVQVNVDANGMNIVGDAANEPSIAVDPNNRNRMAIGWRQFNTITSNFRQAGYGYTTDKGGHWTFPGVIEPGIFRSDPVLRSDADGNFFFNSLTNSPDFLCDVFKSTSGGATWGSKTFAQGGDKQWMAIDNTSGTGRGNIYASWTYLYSICSPGSFTRSTNNGISFENCTTIPDDPYWGTLAVGPSGELYMGGTTGWNFMIAKSLNAQNPGVTPVWSLTADVNLDGYITYNIGPNPGGLGGQTNIAVDTSGGPFNGYVYMLCTVERGNLDPADVMFSRSTDGGVTWSNPIRINNDAGNSAFQWFGTMSVAPNGRIDAVWLDTRDNPGTFLSALYYANSTNAGLNWSGNVRLSDYFNPHLGWPQQNKMGDYYDMFSDSSGVHLAWAATFNGEQDVYYSYIHESAVIPVELVSFTAVAVAGTVTLDWSTATELNNHGFEIQRSSDKSNWVSVGFKKGAGTTSQPQDYSFSDNLYGSVSSILYYRLKQVDYSGSFEYSSIVEVGIAAEFSLSQNYPNPFNPVTKINYSIPAHSFVEMKIFDILGNAVATLVNEEKTSGEYEIVWNADGLPSGVYICRLTAGSFSGTQKLLLMK